MVEIGSIRIKNVTTVLLKNIIDVSLGAIFWWIIGYPLAYGESRLNGLFGFTKDLIVSNNIT